MLHLDQNKINKKIKNWQQQKPLIIAKQDLEEDIQQTKDRKKPPKEQRKAMSTSKFLMFFLFISCTAIQLFTMYAIVKSMNMGYGVDFTPLTMLITAVVAEVMSFAIYSIKSAKENTKGGIIF